MRPSDPPPRPDGFAESDDRALQDDDSALQEIEETVRTKLGLRPAERPTLFRETADAATDADTPFWAVLLLSGAIATLGLILDSAAVVIGAMLVAPLLGPLLGLSLALAVGDGRLFVQTLVTILLGAAGIVALAALITFVLPLQTVTDEIAGRTRPTTLDLAVAVASGLAAAVVTASRETRLSASIPGVAVAVALVPPLGVIGFGLATARWAAAQGAALLFGANLAGIVLSGLVVFLAVGMYRPDTVAAAKAWHGTGRAKGLAARLDHLAALDRLSMLATPRRRLLLAAAFVVLVAVPLATTFRQVVREVRVSGALATIEEVLAAERGVRILDREVTVDDGGARIDLHVATAERLSVAERDSLMAAVSLAAGESVSLTFDQIVVASTRLAALADSLSNRVTARAAEPVTFSDALRPVRDRLSDALGDLALPDSVRVAGGAVWAETAGDAPLVEVAYAAPAPLPASTEAVIARQLARALGLDAGAVHTVAAPSGVRPLPDSSTAAAWAGLLQRYARLRLEIAGDSAAVARAGTLLRAVGVPAEQVSTRQGTTGVRFEVEGEEPNQ